MNAQMMRPWGGCGTRSTGRRGAERARTPQVLQRRTTSGARCAAVRPASSAAAPARGGPSAVELLGAAGVSREALQSAALRCPDLLVQQGGASGERCGPMVDLLRGEGFREPQQLEQLLLKCPQLATYCRSKAEESLRFLSEDLGLSPQQRAEVVRRFPQVLGYGVKSWLLPQLAFLKSLGVPQEGLPALVMARPQVLGSNILLVTRWLTRYVKVPRTKVGAVLHLYPFDYSPAFNAGMRKYVAAQHAKEQQKGTDDDAEQPGGPDEPPGGDSGGKGGAAM